MGALQSNSGGPQAFDKIFKLTFLGAEATGKTCFVHRFADDSYTDLYSSTTGVDFVSQTLRIVMNS
jgi:GTPase SAR1 family protein